MISTLVSIAFIVVFLLVILLRWKRSLLFYPLLFIAIVVLIFFIYLTINNLSYDDAALSLLVNGSLAVAVIAVFILSYPKRIRSESKVKIAKLFSLYKYDYRESWLGFNAALNDASVDGDFYFSSIQALANIINSPSGKLWSERGERFTYTDHWNSALSDESEFQLPQELVDFIGATNWVIDINEYAKQPDIYNDLKLNVSNSMFNTLDIFVPLRRGEQLTGIVGLKKTSNEQMLNWEDHDLLKAAGQQMATYLGLYEATSQIYEQQQLEAFNRLSTFVVHDLKNVAAQLELINHNSEKYKDNREFVDDTFETVKYASSRLRKMLEQLRKKKLPAKEILEANINKIIEQVKKTNPTIKVDILSDDVLVQGDQGQLANIILHLDQNARDSRGIAQGNDDNKVAVTHKIELKETQVLWHIIDDGLGMDEDFIRQKLFKPFVTTKGNSGMGIGVYQCRHLLQSYSGDLIIRSKPDTGTHCVAILQVIMGD